MCAHPSKLCCCQNTTTQLLLNPSASLWHSPFLTCRNLPSYSFFFTSVTPAPPHSRNVYMTHPLLLSMLPCVGVKLRLFFPFQCGIVNALLRPIPLRCRGTTVDISLSLFFFIPPLSLLLLLLLLFHLLTPPHLWKESQLLGNS